MRVFLAEDQYLLRQGLERLLISQGVEVVGSVATADEFLAAVGGSLPPTGLVGAARAPMDLALLDIRMPPTNTDESAIAAPAIIGSVLTAFSAGRVPSDVASGK